MKSEQASNEFYEKLKIQLYDTTSWPSEYLFKFIIATDQKKTQDIERIFSGLKSKFNFLYQRMVGIRVFQLTP